MLTVLLSFISAEMFNICRSLWMVVDLKNVGRSIVVLTTMFLQDRGATSDPEAEEAAALATVRGLM